MQERKIEKPQENAATIQELDNKNGVEKGFFQPSKEKNHRGVHYPEFWRKKRMRLSFVRELEETAKKAAVLRDNFGEYKDGIFLHGCAIVRVTIGNAGLWRLEIHSEHPIGLPMINDIRYKFIPNDVLMAMLFPTREEQEPSNNVTMYQIPNEAGESEEQE